MIMPVLAAGLSALGGGTGVAGVLGGVASALGASSSARAANQQAKYNYKHRYQWQVEDMRKAGINPMLSATQGAGGVPQADVPNIGEAAMKGFSAGAAARMASAQTENIQENTQATRHQGNKAAAEGRAQEMANLLTEASPLYQSAKATLGSRGEVTGPSAASNEKWAAELDVIKNNAEKVAADTKLVRLNQELAEGEITLQQVRLKYADQIEQFRALYQKSMAEAEAAGVPAALAEGQLWESLGVFGKAVQFLKQFVPQGNRK